MKTLGERVGTEGLHQTEAPSYLLHSVRDAEGSNIRIQEVHRVIILLIPLTVYKYFAPLGTS